MLLQVAFIYRLTHSASELSGYPHEFTINQREISISQEAAEGGIENFEFIVSERVQVHPDNSRAGAIIRDEDRKSWDPRAPMVWDIFYF